MEAPELASAAPLPNEPDLADVRGQAHARRALEIAAAGGHGLLFVGPPGTGKSLLARRMPSILPPLTLDEAVEVTRVHSAAGLLLGSRRDGRGLVARRPFRAPHHAISSAAMLGGGRLITPGEMSLAHRGVLFLDELPEFRRDVLESLRQPLEEGAIAVVRVHGRVTLPCRVAVIAAMNPCPCGWHGSRKRACSCSDGQVARYRARLSGPLVDRLDLHVEVPALAFDEIASAKPGEASAVVRRRVAAARSLQLKRARCLNASLPPARLREIARLDDGARSLLQHAVDRMGLSGRAHDRVLQVALTIGDLEGGDRRHGVRVTESHLAEALSHRALDRLTRPVAHAAVHGAQGGRP